MQNYYLVVSFLLLLLLSLLLTLLNLGTYLNNLNFIAKLFGFCKIQFGLRFEPKDPPFFKSNLAFFFLFVSLIKFHSFQIALKV